MTTPPGPTPPYDPSEDPTVVSGAPTPGGPGDVPPPGTTDPTAEDDGKKPWAWITIAGLLAIAAIGLGIWALGLSSDLDDQKDKTAQAQKEADAAKTAAGAASDQADAAASQSKQLQEDVTNLTSHEPHEAGDGCGEAARECERRREGCGAEQDRGSPRSGRRPHRPAEAAGRQPVPVVVGFDRRDHAVAGRETRKGRKSGPFFV